MATANTTDRDWQAERNALQCHAYMFDNSVATDITFVVSNSENHQGKAKSRIIESHKYMLVSRSTVFLTMFYGDVPELRSEIIVDDVDPDAFYKVIRYLYTDEIELDAELVMFILYIAKKYMITTLRAKCTEFLDNNMCAQNVLTLFDQSLFFDEKNMAKKCLKMICQNTSQAIQSDTIARIQHSTLDLIVSQKCLSSQEIELFKACQTWAKRKCEEEGLQVSGPNMRRMLGETLNKIRFPLIPIDSFNDVVAASEILPSSDELKIFRYIAAGSQKNKQDLPYSFDPRFHYGQAIPLLEKTEDEDKEEMHQTQFSFTLEVESDDVINIQGWYICDLDVNYAGGNPQSQNNLAVSLNIDGSQILTNSTVKENVSEDNHVKLIRTYTQLNGKKQTLTLHYESRSVARCGYCSHQHYSYQPNVQTYCQSCRRNSYMNPVGTPASVTLPVLRKSSIHLKDDFANVQVKNIQGSQMPIVGLMYTF